MDSIDLYWKNDSNLILGSITNLKNYLNDKGATLLFAMNGGIYKTDQSPQGLYIQGAKLINGLDTNSGKGNFYMKPNGVFYMTSSNEAHICRSEDFSKRNDVRFATQSGPMLLINGTIHPAFIRESKNLNIRNGVGVLPNNKIVFVMSKKEINLYDFANYFKTLSCTNALYLDGFVSRAYCPSDNWVQLDGNFGVMIGITKRK